MRPDSVRIFTATPALTLAGGYYSAYDRDEHYFDSESGWISAVSQGGNKSWGDTFIDLNAIL
jgi:hypothetical protein